MVNLDGAKAVSKAAKGTHDRLKALEVAIYDLRSGESDKHWQNVDKCLQVVLKVTDLQSIKDHENLLVNLKWILGKSTAPSGPVMNTIGFLTKICSQVGKCRLMLRDNLGLTSTLTNLLLTLGTSSPTKTAKVLELMRYLVHGICILRQESYLEKLLFQLLRFINGKDSLSGASLSILACLCHNNYLVGKLLLTSMTSEERKDLYASSFQDAKLKLYHDFLITGLSRRHILGSTMKSAEGQRHLSTIADAFYAAYSEKDCLSLELCIDFLQDIASDLKDQKLREALMQIIKQLFCVADFADGSGEANALLFAFAKQLACIHGPSLHLVDVTAKGVSLYVETISGPRYVNEAVSMFSELLCQATASDNGLNNETLMSSLKLQVDSLLSAFNTMLQAVNDYDDHENDLASILECCLVLAKIDDWNQLVGAHLSTPALILAKIKTDSRCQGPLLASFFKLAQALKGHKKWNKVLENNSEQGLESIMQTWVQCYQAKCHSKFICQYFEILQDHDSASKLFWSLAETAQTTKDNLEQNKAICLLDDKTRLKDVDQLLSKVATILENNDINECLAGVWQLQEYKLMVHQSKLEALKEALKAADEEISHQKSLNTLLEMENGKLNSFTQTLLHKIDVTQQEILDVRKQCDNIHKNASDFQAQTSKELKSKQEDIEVLESNQGKLEAKLAKYKEKCEALQETIKEHQSVQDELHEKLKIESKNNSDMSTALAKKDEKLKKKEKLLEDEKLAATSLKEEISSMQSLNKRLEAALAKKEKQYTEASEQLKTFKQIQAQIFSLSKTVQPGDDDE